MIFLAFSRLYEIQWDRWLIGKGALQGSKRAARPGLAFYLNLMYFISVPSNPNY